MPQAYSKWGKHLTLVPAIARENVFGPCGPGLNFFSWRFASHFALIIKQGHDICVVVSLCFYFFGAPYTAHRACAFGRQCAPRSAGRFQHFGLCPEPQQPGCRDVFVGVADLQQQASVRLAGIAGRAVTPPRRAVAFAGRDVGRAAVCRRWKRR